MNVGQIQEAIDKAKPLYFVCIKDCTVKTKDKDPNNPSKKMKNDFLINGNPIHYTMPVVAKVYAIDFDVMKNAVTCIYPLDFKPPLESQSYIDYGKVKSEKLFPKPQRARKKITKELVERFISPDFVRKYPQVMDYHDSLKEFYGEPEEPESIEEGLIVYERFPEGNPEEELLDE